MAISIKKSLQVYFNSSWIPFMTANFFIGVLALCIAVNIPDFIFDTFFVIYVISLLGVPAAAIWNLIKKRWLKGILNFVLLSVNVAMIFVTSILLLLTEPSEDSFGKDIIIPPGMKVEAPRQDFDVSLAQPESISEGASDIWLVPQVGQGGIYRVYAYVNPGESGYVYLKVFEATRNTPLSTDRISSSSKKHIKWSNNAEEQFIYNAEITVYEGDWDTYYPARFELWFVPEAKTQERKLIEKIFKIEGWQR